MIAKAIALLHRWLAHDVGEAPDLTLDDETNDLLLAYSAPRAELDQAVLDAMAEMERATLQAWIDRSFRTVTPLAMAELARRDARERADEIRRGLTAAAPEIRERARAGLRRLESMR